MEARRVFVIGNNIFAETLVQLLAGSPDLRVSGSALTIEAALPDIRTSEPDAIIVAGVVPDPDTSLARFIATHPTIPVIRTDLSTNTVQVITSQQVVVHTSTDLLAAINALPKQKS